MMKIVYLIPALYNTGGMERVLSLKANYLVEQGYDISIITSDQMGRTIYFPLDKRIKHYDLGINHEENNGKGVLNKLLKFPFKQYRHKKRLSKLLLDIKADIVISMFGNEASFVTEIKDGSRKILEYHFSKLKRLQYGRKGLWRLIDEWRTEQDEKIVAKFDDFVVLTKEDASLWGELNNILAIPNPLTFDSPDVAPLNDKRIIAVGRLDFQKNFEALVDIWARVASKFPDWHLDIYGDGKDRELLQEQVNRLGLKDRLTLQQPTQRIQEEYLRSSIFVMTSRYEGLPMVLLEAQTMGLPIVSYACKCGPRDIIDDGLSGFLIEPYEEDLFVQRLTQVMEDEELRLQMGVRAKANSLHYQIDNIMLKWMNLFNKKNS